MKKKHAIEPLYQTASQHELADVEIVPDQSRLGVLYPTAKTPAQKHQDDIRRLAAFEKRRPKFPSIKAAIAAAVLWGVVVLFLQFLPLVWATASIAFIFFSFAVWIILTGLAVWWVWHVNETLYIFARKRSLFWGVFCAVMLVVCGLWASPFLLPPGNFLWSGVAAGVAFVVTFVLFKVLLLRNPDANTV